MSEPAHSGTPTPITDGAAAPPVDPGLDAGIQPPPPTDGVPDPSVPTPAVPAPEAVPAPPAVEAPAAVDPTLDIADRPPDIAAELQDAALRALELLEAGGPVVVVLLAASVIATAIILVKIWQFRAARIGDRRVALDAVRLWRTGQPTNAVRLAVRSRNPVAQAVARAMRGQRRGIPEGEVREEVMRYGGDALEVLRRGFRPLELIASLAPLLGLFGTVLGMIDAFRALEAGGSRVDPATLSGGIWEALLTTALGLAVAMPVIVVLNWLEGRVDRVAHDLESIVTRVFTRDLSPDPEDLEVRGRLHLHSAVHAGE